MREVYDPRELQKLDVNEIVTSDEEEDLKSMCLSKESITYPKGFKTNNKKFNNGWMN